MSDALKKALVGGGAFWGGPPAREGELTEALAGFIRENEPKPARAPYKSAFLPLSAGADGGVSLDWSAGLPGALWNAFTLPGDVAAGRTAVFDPATGHVADDVIGRGTDLVGALTLGAGAMPAARNSLRAGIRLPMPVNRPAFPIRDGTIDSFLKEAGIPFKVSRSTSFASPSTYYYVETPSGKKKIRVSDHAGGFGEDLDIGFGEDTTKTLKMLVHLIGRDDIPIDPKSIEISRLKSLIAELDPRYSEDAIAKYRRELESLSRPSIRAYHGSPHDFDKFDSSKR